MKLFYGLIIDCETIDNLRIRANTAIVVDNDGKVLLVKETSDWKSIQEEYGIPANSITILEDSEFLMPGMIDTHIHAPQYVNAGFALDIPLLGWLNKYTFPAEARFSDVNFAREVYSRVVANTLANGTTTAMYFATLHKESSLLLGDLAHQQGQRAYIGKVSMDQNSPDYYIEESSTAITDAEDFIVALQEKNYPIVKPVITPRFAISCTMDLMKKLGSLAEKYDVNIQTHVSENLAECDFAVSLHGDCKNYVDIYATANLLTPKTVLAHGVHLSDEELGIIHQYKTAVSHCPNSNCSIRSGLCDVQRLISKGIPVGLGTDVSGGFSPSLLDAMRFAITVSNMLSLSKPESYKPVTYKEAFFLATLGGAQALGIGDKVGNFEVGKEFDALTINLAQPDGNIELWPDESTENRLSKWIHLGDDRSIASVFVRGNEVKEAARSLLRSQRQVHKRKLPVE